MGYAQKMQADIAKLLELFGGLVPDRDSHARVSRLVANSDEWQQGREIFQGIRDRNLEAIERGDRVAEAQFCFEEVCVQSLFNETDTDMPFDSCSPYWIIPNAFSLAAALRIESPRVLTAVGLPPN